MSNQVLPTNVGSVKSGSLLNVTAKIVKVVHKTPTPMSTKEGRRASKLQYQQNMLIKWM